MVDAIANVLNDEGASGGLIHPFKKLTGITPATVSGKDVMSGVLSFVILAPYDNRQVLLVKGLVLQIRAQGLGIVGFLPVDGRHDILLVMRLPGHVVEGTTPVFIAEGNFLHHFAEFRHGCFSFLAWQRPVSSSGRPIASASC